MTSKIGYGCSLKNSSTQSPMSRVVVEDLKSPFFHLNDRQGISEDGMREKKREERVTTLAKRYWACLGFGVFPLQAFMLPNGNSGIFEHLM